MEVMIQFISLQINHNIWLNKNVMESDKQEKHKRASCNSFHMSFDGFSIIYSVFANFIVLYLREKADS